MTLIRNSCLQFCYNATPLFRLSCCGVTPLSRQSCYDVTPLSGQLCSDVIPSVPAVNMSRGSLFLVVLLAMVAVSWGSPQWRTHRRFSPSPSRPNYGRAAMNAASQAAGSRYGLGGGWSPKAGGVRVWRSRNGRAGLGVGFSSDGRKNHGVGLGFKLKF